MYDIRSAVEHLNPIDTAIGEYASDERIELALRRGRQVEALALSLYLDIAQQNDLRKLFINDLATDAFWARPDDEKMRMWKNKIDLNGVQ